MELAKERGITIPQWGDNWRKMDTYNGFTHEQRVRQWAAVKLAIRFGILPSPEVFKCSVCGTSKKLGMKIVYHTEDYSDLYGDFPVCEGCHRKIHLRFRYPDMWSSVLKAHGRSGTKWFEKISRFKRD